MNGIACYYVCDVICARERKRVRDTKSISYLCMPTIDHTIVLYCCISVYLFCIYIYAETPSRKYQSNTRSRALEMNDGDDDDISHRLSTAHSIPFPKVFSLSLCVADISTSIVQFCFWFVRNHPQCLQYIYVHIILSKLCYYYYMLIYGKYIVVLVISNKCRLKTRQRAEKLFLNLRFGVATVSFRRLSTLHRSNSNPWKHRETHHTNAL